MKLPDSYYNKISFFGSLISGFSFVIIVFLFVVTLISGSSSAYTGLVLYMILPVFLITGLVMIPLGMRIKVKRERRNKKEDLTWKIIDLNVPRTRNGMIIFVAGTFVLLFATSIGSYKAFHFSESTEFCGTLCHEVMKPEYTAYQNSPHARVACVECHVGEGANWYVKSKLSGLHQVYYAVAKKYPRPIPTPISNLRPARETCEKCHWPNKFYASRIINHRSFLADSGNTPWNITLKMKTGAKHSTNSLQEGIHWHINSKVKIEYVSSDNNREIINWVRYVNIETNDTIVYNDEMNPPDQEMFDTIPLRTMDCMDCHNRPSHLYNSPTNFVDNVLNVNESAAKIPYFKLVAMTVLQPPYKKGDSTSIQIRNRFEDAYKDEYPDVYAEKKLEINKAVDEVIVEFEKNSFPDMEVYHNTYTNHIGHQESLGCFRCHSGYHVSDEGSAIRKDCNLCHTIVAQGKDDNLMTSGINDALEFKHPENIDLAWMEMSCSECHSALY